MIHSTAGRIEPVFETPPEAALTASEERRVLKAARRAKAGLCDRAELYRNGTRLGVREMKKVK